MRRWATILAASPSASGLTSSCPRNWPRAWSIELRGQRRRHHRPLWLGDETLIVWDLTTGEERHHFLNGHAGRILSCAVSADGGTGLSASDDETLIVWDLASGKARQCLSGHKGRVSGCAISADGRTGVSASSDRTLIVWELANGTERCRLLGHSAQVLGCAVSTDARIGLSASDDQTLIVWDLTTGEERHHCAVTRAGSRAAHSAPTAALVSRLLTTAP